MRKKALIFLGLLIVIVCTVFITPDQEAISYEETTEEVPETEVASIAVSTTEPVTTEEVTTTAGPEIYTVNLKMVGDDLIHDTLYNEARQSNGSYNFDFMFEHLKPDIQAADLAIINQETIFIEDRSKLSGYPKFGSPVEVGDSIVKAGFDIVTHSTNHTIDQNLEGITDTINFWETKYPEISYLGIHDSPEDSDITYIQKNNIKFAFVNYTYGLNGLESWRKGNEYMIDLLKDPGMEETLMEAEANSDLTVAILHIGNEYVYKPSKRQLETIDKCIDNGADIVLCAHPHVVQPYEMRTTATGNTGLVYYSLGNFISAQKEIPRMVGGMADITITKTIEDDIVQIEITDYTMIPLITHQHRGHYTTYKLEDYTDELCRKHRLYQLQPFDCAYLKELYEKPQTLDFP